MALQKVIKAVTPAKAGVQKCLFSWIPAFAGMTEKRLLGLLASPAPVYCALFLICARAFQNLKL